jgi:hypothetical protein
MLLEYRAAIAALLSATSACTLLLARDDRQCGFDSDCERLGLSGAFCDAEGACRPRPAESGAVAGCAKAADCGSFARCSAGRCRPLASAECPNVGGATDDQAIVIGILTPRSGPAARSGLRSAAIMTRALGDPTLAGGPGFVTVECDEARLTDGVLAHLSSVSARAVIGPLDEGRALTIVDRAAAMGIAVLSPYAGSSEFQVRARPRPHLMSAAPPVLDGIATFRAGFESARRAIVRRDRRAIANIVVYTTNDRPSAEFTERIIPILRSQFPLVRRVAYDDPTTGSAAPAARLATYALMDTYDVVVAATSPTGEFSTIVREIEANWPETRPRPYYVTWHRDGGLVEAGIVGRAFAVDFAPPPTVVADTALATFRERVADLAPLDRDEIAYDAAFLLAYALSARRDRPPIADLRADFERLSVPGAVAHGLGIASWRAAATALANGGGLDVHGASGRLDFASGRSGPRDDGALHCLEADPARPGRGRWRRTGASIIEGVAQGMPVCGTTW